MMPFISQKMGRYHKLNVCGSYWCGYPPPEGMIVSARVGVALGVSGVGDGGVLLTPGIVSNQQWH